MKLFSRRKARREGYSVIDEGTSITGDLVADGVVRVDGHIDGANHRAGAMIIGEGASVVGNVEAREVVVAGEVTGSLRAAVRVEVQQTGTVRGDILSPSVVLAEGGAVQGHVVVQPLDEPTAIEGDRHIALTPGRAVPAMVHN